ncbi:uncharacterized protein LOC104854087 [Fukomys damarensis]|uniref:uncharacterized protein LOC104854087 n=1 Tax=Fukomys damarensis TaxID=885580 RepID=UPI001455BB42|nr:uncharacterized protein LOC104854087 [Fukomys damarensis]
MVTASGTQDQRVVHLPHEKKAEGGEEEVTGRGFCFSSGSRADGTASPVLGRGGLNVPVPVAWRVQPPLVCDGSCGLHTGEILLIGRCKEDGIPELVLSGLVHTPSVIAVHHKDPALGILKGVASQQPDLVLGTHIPHGPLKRLAKIFPILVDSWKRHWPETSAVAEVEGTKDGMLNPATSSSHTSFRRARISRPELVALVRTRTANPQLGAAAATARGRR